jgi:hypothetical protein
MTRHHPQTSRGPVAPGYVRLTCGDPAFALVTLLGEEAPQLSGGFGGWNVIGRPRDVGMTVWDGVEPYQLTLPLMLDAFADNRSQEGIIRRLTAVARGDRESPPGVLTVEGLPSLSPPSRHWVIESMEFGDAIRRVSDMHRTRQQLTLALREYVRPEYLSRRKTTSKTSSKSIIVIAQKGDTAAKIAKRRRLKSWTLLRNLNRGLILKANQTIPTGTPVLVPVTKLAAKSKRQGSKG